MGPQENCKENENRPDHKIGTGCARPEPVVSSRGVIVGPHGEELDMEAAGAARRILKAWRKEKTSIEALEENLRTAVRRIYRKALDKKPTVLPVIIED